MQKNNRRIPYALFTKDWEFGQGGNNILTGHQVTPEEYQLEMKHSLFCPICTTPLSRVPEKGELFSNKRPAHFRHLGKFKRVPCDLRTTKPEGMYYEDEEEASKAIESRDLVIVSAWMSTPPADSLEYTDDEVEFKQTSIEDMEGEKAEVPIARHQGKVFELPTKISSVLALCRNFDLNLYRGYYFPESQYPMRLCDMLFSVKRVRLSISYNSRLFFGRIVRYTILSYRSVISLECEKSDEIFKVYSFPNYDQRKGIGQNSIGRVLLAHSSLQWEGGTPRCFIDLWGAYALLPDKYERFLRF